MRQTDLELVRQARDGDEEAYHELVSRYAAEMFRLAYSLVGNAQDAEDIVQETFSGAFQGMVGFEERSSVKTWLSRIMVRQSAQCLRRRELRRTVSFDRINEASDSQTDARPTASAENMDMKLDVMETLKALSKEHREVIVLREMQGMSYDEMASTLDVPRGTIESRLFRAREEMRNLLKDYRP